jgi:YHS domain-containing protein
MWMRYDCQDRLLIDGERGVAAYLAAGGKPMNELARRCLLQAAIATILCGTWASLPASAGDATPVAPRVAIDGYDPVAYFTDGRPVKGSPTFSFTFDDAVYYFVSAEHQKMFAADPDRYAPQYSGYCTIGVSMGMKAQADPQRWAISNGRLYIFYDQESHTSFTQDSAGIIAKADTNWPALKGQH